jgi:hypothetical protein
MFPVSKKFARILLFFGFVFILIICLPVLVHAQIGDPGCDPLCNCRADGTYCPIDGGLGFLLAAGIGYGIKRVKDSKKDEMNVNKD